MASDVDVKNEELNGEYVKLFVTVSRPFSQLSRHIFALFTHSIVISEEKGFLNINLR